MIGTTIGKYRIVGLLGRGATGIVYKAVDDTLERDVAIKVLHPHFAAAAEFMKRFRGEATILARLSHPEIATIHELLRTDTDLLMVMELVRGETLEDLVNRVGPVSPDLAGRLLDGILSALDHAHRAGIVHRDLKPANVMVTQLGGIKIMDFGIARVRGAEHITIDGGAVGTPAYMPPEQVLGEEIDGRADLYAVGVILYRLLTGKLPFDAETPMAMLHKQIAEPPPPLHLHRPGLPEWCEPVVQRALAKAPADRFQSAEEFRTAVGRATGVAPSIDLAKVFAIGAGEIAARTPAPSPVETVALSPAATAISEKVTAEPAAARTARLPSRVPALLVRANRFASTREGLALLGGLGVALAIVAYLGGSSLADDSAAPPRNSERRSADHGTPVVEIRVAEPLAAPASTPPPPKTETVRARAPESDASTATAPSAVVFRTKIVRAPGGQRSDADARLSLAKDHLTVAPYGAPEDLVFSAHYRDISSVRHSREPAWKPPRKISKVIRVENDVLDAFGIRERHHVSLYTASKDEFVVLRVDERSVSRLLKELKQRTGLDAERGTDR